MGKTKSLAEAILRAIQFSTAAHIHHPKTPDAAVRFWDRTTPYIVHPTWCAMTLLTETALAEDMRITGYQALLWHDVLEDTTITALPDGTPDRVRQYVQDMTFDSFSEERKAIWGKDKEIRLLKLYDKTSNLLDGSWMSDAKWASYTAFTQAICKDVEAHYGPLNIVKISNAIAISRFH